MKCWYYFFKRQKLTHSIIRMELRVRNNRGVPNEPKNITDREWSEEIHVKSYPGASQWTKKRPIMRVIDRLNIQILAL